MRKDRDYYEAGSTFAGLIGSSIIFIFLFLVVRFLLRVLGAAIEKIGLLSALCAGICIYHVLAVSKPSERNDGIRTCLSWVRICSFLWDHTPCI